MNTSMVSQQILTTVMTCIAVDKNTDQAKPHWICFYHNIRKKSLLRFAEENTDTGLKVHALHYANELLCTRQTFLSKPFANSLNMQKQ